MAQLLNSILLATNLQDYNKVAFDVAASIATHYQARLILIHVLEKIPEHIESRLSWLFGEEQRKAVLKSQAEKAHETLVGKNISSAVIRTALDDYCTSAGLCASQDGPERDIIVTEGDVVESVLKYSEELGCGMIVLATHEGLFTKSSVSGVVKNILKNSTVPVLTVPHVYNIRSKSDNP